MDLRLGLLGFSLFILTLFVGLGIPLMRRRIGPNDSVGVRTPETLRDPDIWYDANEYCGRLMVGTGLAVGFLALTLYCLPSISEVTYTLTTSIATILLLLALIWKSLSYTRNLVIAKNRKAGEIKADQDWDASLRTLGLVIIILVSVLLIVPSIPFALGHVQPNNTSGFRVAATMNDPAIWYKVNAYMGKALIAAGGLAIMLMSGLYFVRRISNLVYLLISIMATIFPPLIAILFSYAYLHSLVSAWQK